MRRINEVIKSNVINPNARTDLDEDAFKET